MVQSLSTRCSVRQRCSSRCTLQSSVSTKCTRVASMSSVVQRSSTIAFAPKQEFLVLPHPQQRRQMRVWSKNDSLEELEVEVPVDQRPVNELQQLKSSFLYSWGTLETGEYIKRLIILWGAVFAGIGCPIAFQTFDPAEQLLEFSLSAATGSLVVVAIANLRIFLGWKYVADRLMTATLEYEETGWYDGQFFVKPPEILTRDRLLGTYEARPVLSRLKTTLQGTGVVLLSCAVTLFVSIKSVSDSDGVYGRGAARVTPEGILFSDKVDSVYDLYSDDEAAAAEAAAQGNIPGYCRDRYFKAMSGEEDVCSKLTGSRR